MCRAGDPALREANCALATVPRAAQAVDLSDPTAVAAWVTVNDPMMGARSTSTFSVDGGLVFSGIISLDNNGGFPSARGPFDPEIERRATGATSLRVRALGDGKTYRLKVETGRPWSYVQRFATDAGIRRAYVLPVGGFQPVGRFPDPAPGAPPLDPSTISRIAFCIVDEQRTWRVPTRCQRHRRLRTRIRPPQFYGFRARIWTTAPEPW
jgi:hypothetical protein